MDDNKAPQATDDDKMAENLIDSVFGGIESDVPAHQKDGYNPLADFVNENQEGSKAADQGQGSNDNSDKGQGDNTPPSTPPSEETSAEQAEADRRKIWDKKLKSKDDYSDLERSVRNRLESRTPSRNRLQEDEGLEDAELDRRMKQIGEDNDKMVSMIQDTHVMLKDSEQKVKRDFDVFDDTPGNESYNPKLHEAAERLHREYLNKRVDNITEEAYEANDTYNLFRGMKEAFDMGREIERREAFEAGRKSGQDSMAKIKTQAKSSTPNPTLETENADYMKSLLTMALSEDKADARY